MTKEELKALRTSLGMSQWQFGAHLGNAIGSQCARTGVSISEWERKGNIPEWLDANIDKIKEHKQ